MIISSTANPTFRNWKELNTSKGIREQGQFILMGEKLIQEFLRHPNHDIIAEIKTETQRPISSSLKTISLPEKMFEDLDFLGTHFNLLVLKTKEHPSHQSFSSLGAPQGLEVIAPLGDPSNMGALIRSAVGFGVKKIILTTESCNPYLPKAMKASSGAILKSSIEYLHQKVSDLPTRPPENHFALDAEGEDIYDFQFSKNLRLLIGEEGPGLSTHLDWPKLSIKTQGIESLNATVAASITFFAYQEKNK